MTQTKMTAEIVDGSQYETIRFPNDEILLRVTAGGYVQVIEYLSADRDGPPPHYHPWDEVQYVMEGNVEFYLNGRWITGGPGTVQMLPAGAAHSIRVPSESARLLFMAIGAPYDGFGRELASLYAQDQASLPNIVAVANHHGVRLAGDPVGY